MRVILCGQVAVEGTERPVPAGRAQHALAYLAAHRPQAVRREALIDALWPRDPPRDPRAVLNSLVSRLRRSLGAKAIEGGATLRLALPPGSSVDVEEAEAAIGEATAARAAERWQAAWEHASVARDIAERGFLPEFESPWIDERRAEVETLLLDALDCVAAAGPHLGPEQEAEAERAARAAVARAPLREAGYATLMGVLAARGNVAEALAAYEQLRVMLRDELGMTPAPEVRQLHERLLLGAEEPVAAHAPSFDEPASPAFPLPLPRPLADAGPEGFVDRAAELGALRVIFEEARSNGPVIAVVSGRVGAGKTRLASVWSAEAHRAGAAVLLARCYQDVLVPGAPLAEALRRYLEATPPEAIPPAAAPLAALVPEARARLGVSAGAGRPRSAQDVATATEALLRAAARTRPVVLVIDALGGADALTLAVTGHLLRTLGRLPLLVLVTVRSLVLRLGMPAARLLEAQRREGRRRDVTLGGLDAAALAELTRARLGDADPAFVAELHARTAGNALAATELIEAVRGSADRLAALASAVPEDAVSRVLARAGVVAPELRALLDTAAVLGERFDAELLVDVTGDRGATLSGLEQAVSLGLLDADREAPETFSFALPLLRDALLEGAGVTGRARLHARVAEALSDAVDDERILARARHAIAAVPAVSARDAARSARTAAERLLEDRADDDAATLIGAALELDPPGDERAELLLGLGEARRRLAAGAARSAFDEAFDLAEALSDGDLLARAELGRSSLGFGDFGWDVYGVVDRALVGRLDRALAAVEPDDPLRPVLLARLAVEWSWGDPARALELSVEAEAGIGLLDSEADRARVRMARFFALRGPNNTARRLEIAGRVAEAARARGDRAVEAACIVHTMPLLIELGRLATVRDDVARLGALGEELNDPRHMAYARHGRALFATLEGDLDDAERLVREAYAVGGEAPGGDADLTLQVMTLRIRLHQGRESELVPGMVHLAELHPSVDALRGAVGYVCLLAGNVDAGRRALEAWPPGSLAEAGRSGGSALFTQGMLGLIAARLGDRERAEEVTTLLSPFVARHMAPRAPVHYTPVAYVAGLLAGATGRDDDAVELLEAAAAAAAELGARGSTGQARCELALALLRRGDRRGAAAALAAAREVDAPALGALTRRIAEVEAALARA